jgi:lipopolysaccharide export LptBFGC system permease protein LptF
MIRGRKETYANLFLGVFVCLLFFLLCKILGEMMSHYGFGWWLGNVVTLICGIILVLKKEKK